MTDATTNEGPGLELAATHADASAGEKGVEYARVKSLVRGALFGRGDTPVRIGRFTVLGRLGQGAMSVVYAAYDDELDRKVALKLLRPEGNDAQASARLRREAQAIARLSHPNVVPVYEVGEHDGELFIAMEFVRGATLRTWLETARGWPELRDVLQQAAQGLAAAHEAGIVHRDFKPENVMVGDDGRVRVLDFGVAALGESGQHRDDAGVLQTRAGTLIGTPAYMAPEGLARRVVDARGDQFSFCVVALEAASGRRPFEGETIEALQRAVETGPSSSTGADLSPGVRAALLQGLSSDPEARHASMAPLLRALDPPAAPRWRTPVVTSLVGAGVLAGAWSMSRTDDRCRTAEADLAAVWGSQARSEATRALADAQPPVALGTWTDATLALDGYADRWLNARTEACERGPDDDETALQVALCFEWALSDLGRVVDPLREGAASVAEDVPSRVASLFDPGQCSDAAARSSWARVRSQRAAPAPDGSESGLLSDFEQVPYTRFGAGWAVSTDHFVGGTSTATMTVEEGGRGGGQALRVAGEVLGKQQPTWAGAMVFLGATPFAPANLQSKGALSFWARGKPGPYAVMLFTVRNGFEPARVEFDVREDWTRTQIDLGALSDERYDVTAIFIGRVRPGAFDLRVDDVGFADD
ncbi:MAG: protein kinase [Myxococcota bacterium]